VGAGGREDGGGGFAFGLGGAGGDAGGGFGVSGDLGACIEGDLAGGGREGRLAGSVDVDEGVELFAHGRVLCESGEQGGLEAEAVAKPAGGESGVGQGKGEFERVGGLLGPVVRFVVGADLGCGHEGNCR